MRRFLRVERLDSRVLLHAGTVAGVTSEGEDVIAADFALIDVNSQSASYQQSISPREYLQQVTGWYFTFAT